MKVRLFKLPMFLIAICAITFVSCSDDDGVPDNIIVSAFNEKYPEAKKVSWETKQSYKVADFIFESKEREAWFDVQGNWLLTETDLRFDELPLAVQESFVSGAYTAWQVDDVDMIERYNTEIIYVVEVEKGDQEIDLYYTEDGTLIKEVTEDTGQSHQPIEITKTINDFISEKYSGAKILEYDNEKYGIEVDILHNGIYKDVYFSTSGEWIRTEWDIRTNQVPDIVMNAIKSSIYVDYKIDDVEIHEMPAGVFYAFELEKGNQEIDILVSEDGIIKE